MSHVLNYIYFQVMALYITGSLNAVLGTEHQKEIIRYLYNHQVYVYHVSEVLHIQ